MENKENIYNEEYEAQYFEKFPSEFVNSLENSVKECFTNKLSVFEDELKTLHPNYSQESLQQGMTKLREHTLSQIQKILSKLQEHVMERIFKIPHNVLLPEDLKQKSKPSDDEIKELENDFEILKKEFKNEEYVLAKIKEETEEVERVLSAQKVFLSQSSSLPLENIKEGICFYKDSINDLDKVHQKVHDKASSLLGSEVSTDEDLFDKLVK